MKKVLLLIPLLIFLWSFKSHAQDLDNTVVNISKCGLNYFFYDTKIAQRATSSAGFTAGQSMPVTFNVVDLGNCDRVVAAYVWWTVSYTNNTPRDGILTITDPDGEQSQLNASITGEQGDKCWTSVGEQGTRGYRVNVTNVVNQNGQYTLSVNTGDNETDGLTLFVIYRDLQAGYEGHIKLNDGLFTRRNGNNQSYTLSGFDACEATSDAEALIIASDLQKNTTENFRMEVGSETTNVPKRFWNTNAIDTDIDNNQNSLSMELQPLGSDCFSWIMAGLYMQTQNCTDCPEEIDLNASANPDTVCRGDQVNLRAFGAEEYRWTTLAGVVISNNQFATPEPAGNTTYIVRGRIQGGCITTFDTVDVFVRDNPEIDLGGDVEICRGERITIGSSATGGQGPYDYRWNPAIFISDSEVRNPEVFPNSTTTYHVRVIDANGCEGRDSITVTVHPGLDAEASNDVEICEGSAASLSVQVQGPNPPFSYQWTPAAGLDDPTSDSPEASPGQTTTYEVVVTDANGCESADQVTVTVNPRPIAEAGDDVDICFGESVVIGGNATSGTPPFTYQWTPVTGLDDPTIPQPVASPDDSTMYIVTVTDSKGCINSDTVNVNVWPLPEPVIIPDGPLRFCECDSVILDAGAEYIEYLWSTGETSQTIVVRDDGDYTVTVTDSNGCVNTSPPVTVSIIRPTATIALPQIPVRSEPGMMVTIPLELLESSKLDSCNAFDFTAEISLNRSILVPKGTTDQGTLNGDTRTINVTGARISGNQLLAELDFRSTLGNVEFTDMVIDNFVFNDCFFEVETLDGQFYLDSLCREGGTTRLFMAEGTLSMAVMPNPADDIAEIAVNLPKDTYYSIKIYDLLGKRIRSIAEGSARKGSLNTTADLRDIRPGVYMLVLTIDNGSVTNILEVK